MPPLITIGVSCYNEAATIMSLLRSIFAQTYPHWELIVVDDGSTDETLSLLQRVDDERVRIVAGEENRGRAARYNQVTSLAEGEYLARIDGDDVMFPTRLERQMAFLQERSDIDVLGTGIVTLDENGDVQGERYAPPDISSPVRILAGEVLYHPTVLTRTEWLTEHLYPEDFPISVDFGLWARAASNLHAANLQEPLVFYRENGGPSYQKFLQTIQYADIALRRYGPPAIGRTATTLLRSRRMCKNTVYRCLYRSGLWNLVPALRNRTLTEEQRAHYAEILRTIHNTPIPGMDDFNVESLNTEY